MSVVNLFLKKLHGARSALSLRRASTLNGTPGKATAKMILVGRHRKLLQCLNMSAVNIFCRNLLPVRRKTRLGCKPPDRTTRGSGGNRAVETLRLRRREDPRRSRAGHGEPRSVDQIGGGLQRTVRPDQLEIAAIARDGDGGRRPRGELQLISIDPELSRQRGRQIGVAEITGGKIRGPVPCD